MASSELDMVADGKTLVLAFDACRIKSSHGARGVTRRVGCVFGSGRVAVMGITALIGPSFGSCAFEL